jgi:hypothetical protein
MIRNFFIMNSNGLLLFSDEINTKFQAELMSGFISAIYSFMQHTIFTNDLDNIEVGGLRFVFEIHEIGEENSDLIFTILCDSTDNMAYIKPKLEETKWKFLELFYSQAKHWESGNRAIFDAFKPIEREIIGRESIILDKETEANLLKNFHKLIQISEYLIGAALLTQKGHVVLSFIDNTFLGNILHTLEGRFYAGFTKIQTIITKEADGILVLIGCSEHTEIISALLFNKECPIGTALVLGEQFSNSIKEILERPK